MSAGKRTGGGFKAAVVLLACLALLAVAVFADTIETRIQLLPTPDRPPFARPLAIGILLVLAVVVLVRFVRSRRATGRTLRLSSTHEGVAATATRTRAFVQAFGNLYPEVDARALGYHYTVLADETGIGFWGGVRAPELVLLVPWDDVRTVRSDTVTVGDASRPALVVRVRHAGSSLELPVLLTPSRRERDIATELGKRGEASFAVVRRFKACQREHLLRGGMTFEQAMHIAPITSPIDVATARAELARLEEARRKAAASADRAGADAAPAAAADPAAVIPDAARVTAPDAARITA